MADKINLAIVWVCLIGVCICLGNSLPNFRLGSVLCPAAGGYWDGENKGDLAQCHDLSNHSHIFYIDISTGKRFEEHR